ncbi:rhodanese-like domain-containing protein [Flavobacteriales bacterium]|nr:rhodanese-like domain-containing protein [Flavobacteriales bacterium]
MNRALLFLIIIFFISCSNKSTLVYEKTDILSLDKILNDTDIIILDVRTSEEIDAGYIPNSTFIDYYDKNFENKINLIDPSKKIYTLCKSGGRSVKAAEILSKNGFRNVYNLEGGFMRWKANKMPYDINLVNNDSSNTDLISEIRLDSLIKNNTNTLIYISTKWCSPCKKMEPIIDKLVDNNGSLKVIKIDLDANTYAQERFDVKSLPALVLYENNSVVWHKNGIIAYDDLISFF